MTRIFKPDSGQVLEIQDEGGSAALSVETDGDVTVDAGNLVIGTAGKGVDFAAQTVSSQTGTTPDTSAGDEVLNHYETGSWSAQLADGSGNNMTMSYGTGYYTRIGNLVTVSGYLGSSSLASAVGSIKITGLPFNVANHSAAHTGGGAAAGFNLNITAGHTVSCYTTINNSFFYLMLWDSTGGTTNLQASEWSADGQIVIGFSYRTA